VPPLAGIQFDNSQLTNIHHSLSTSDNFSPNVAPETSHWNRMPFQGRQFTNPPEAANVRKTFSDYAVSHPSKSHPVVSQPTQFDKKENERNNVVSAPLMLLIILVGREVAYGGRDTKPSTRNEQMEAISASSA
jgi:hypothetical protein